MRVGRGRGEGKKVKARQLSRTNVPGCLRRSEPRRGMRPTVRYGAENRPRIQVRRFLAREEMVPRLRGCADAASRAGYAKCALVPVAAAHRVICTQILAEEAEIGASKMGRQAPLQVLGVACTVQ